MHAYNQPLVLEDVLVPEIERTRSSWRSAPEISAAALSSNIRSPAPI